MTGTGDSYQTMAVQYSRTSGHSVVFARLLKGHDARPRKAERLHSGPGGARAISSGITSSCICRLE